MLASTTTISYNNLARGHNLPLLTVLTGLFPFSFSHSDYEKTGENQLWLKLGEQQLKKLGLPG